MLKFLRKNTKIIVWAVVIAFVSWGGYAVSLQLQEASRSPGRIFGKEVSFRDYLLASKAVQLFSPASGAGQEPPSPQEIETRTWQFLILSREAKKRRIKATDDEVRQAIAQLLSPEGGVPLTGDQYLRWVRTQLREEPREFENQVREHLRIQKLLAEVRQEMGADTPEDKLTAWLVNLVQSAKIEVYPSRT
jgi:hypothetical protein